MEGKEYNGLTYLKDANLWQARYQMNQSRKQATFKDREHAAYQWNLFRQEDPDPKKPPNDVAKPLGFTPWTPHGLGKRGAYILDAQLRDDGTAMYRVGNKKGEEVTITVDEDVYHFIENSHNSLYLERTGFIRMTYEGEREALQRAILRMDGVDIQHSQVKFKDDDKTNFRRSNLRAVPKKSHK